MKETATIYEIRVQGHLSPHRFHRFEGLTVTQQPSGETVIVGPLQDQAALYGLLDWLQHLGATLLLVRRIEDSRWGETLQGKEIGSKPSGTNGGKE